MSCKLRRSLTPIPDQDQKPNDSTNYLKKQLDKNFTPTDDKQWDGLNSLRPASW
jgi:hypothetical protein